MNNNEYIKGLFSTVFSLCDVVFLFILGCSNHSKNEHIAVNVNHLVLLENSNIVIQTIDLIDKLEVTSVHFVVQNLYFLLKVFAFALLVASAYARPQSFDNFEGITLEGDGNFDDATIQELAANDLYDVSTIYDIS